MHAGSDLAVNGLGLDRLHVWIPAFAGMTEKSRGDDGWWVKGMTGRRVEWAGDGAGADLRVCRAQDGEGGIGKGRTAYYDEEGGVIAPLQVRAGAIIAFRPATRVQRVSRASAYCGVVVQSWLDRTLPASIYMIT